MPHGLLSNSRLCEEMPHDCNAELQASKHDSTKGSVDSVIKRKNSRTDTPRTTLSTVVRHRRFPLKLHTGMHFMQDKSLKEVGPGPAASRHTTRPSPRQETNKSYVVRVEND
ncbi:hypothetical protein MN608_07339 [Microdochium nivale]|nr:hypothetical protein MN608_07339 [Microdochium nivale]